MEKASITRNRPIEPLAVSTETPLISVLIPFYKESPAKLLRALKSRNPHAIEIVLIDDGSNMPDITTEVCDFMAQSSFAVDLITLEQNEGRARGRNRLTAAARAPYYLFLDADMYPNDEGFLDRWLEHIETQQPAVTFGGFGIDQGDHNPIYAVHRALAAHSDSLKADERAKCPEKYVFTSNLLVHRDVFETEGFDPQFRGWGWEDVEWAMRVSRRFAINHIDNEALHLGLDTVDSLLHKYGQSVQNFARVIDKHPDIVKDYPSYRAARKLAKLPLVTLLKQILPDLVRAKFIPVPARAFALRLYRVTLYAKVVA